MLKFLTSLSFLYLFTIVVLLGYGWIYYRNFRRSATTQRGFPIVFLLICAAGAGFLWINIDAPLRLHTFSNLDHHFIRHDGFVVNKSIELGKTDTVNNANNSFNRFAFGRKNGQVIVNASYSEEPFYISGENGYHILSVNFPAVAHTISFLTEGTKIGLSAPADNSFQLAIGDSVYRKDMSLKKASSAWNLFRDDEAFINSPFYTNAGLTESLKNILFLRDDVSRQAGGELKFFLSGRLFNYAYQINYDDRPLSPGGLAFIASVPDGQNIAWGLGFLDNNRNQYRMAYGGNDSFSILNKYPIAYPLTEENRQDWSRYTVSKFVVADPLAMQQIPLVFREGFLFSFPGDALNNSFAPLLLTYKKGAKNDPLEMTMRRLDRPGTATVIQDERLLLPSHSSSFNWIFSIHNTYDWDFGGYSLTASIWQYILFGSLIFYFLAIFLTALVRPAMKQSWVWQLLSCVTVILLVTRYFLYWRYKSFPPYEGMDLPSQQQLQSFGNFGIIVLSAIALGIIFGHGGLKYIGQSVWRLITGRSKYAEPRAPSLWKWENYFSRKFPSLLKIKKWLWFSGSWLLILIAAGGVAAINHFDAGVCRHLAIALILVYFFFLYISYRYSPLVSSSDRSWWHIATGRPLDIVISNPVKILLSVSLLALFVFIDIGFAIVFLNFLLFNEAFLCINYGIAGLSAGGKRNAGLFAMLGGIYLVFFILNLLYAPYVFKFLLELPPMAYLVAYMGFAIAVAYTIGRLLQLSRVRKRLTLVATAAVLFAVCFFFFPKESILDKAAMTKYRIDVLATPVDKAIAAAYEEGKTYEPVIRAAQNQWFINTFIYEEHNPGVQSAGFNLLPHAPQNKGAKYNAQATDLVTSRFFIAEHGKWSVLLYVLLLLLPTIMLASFYKLYPDFTNRVNSNYPAVTAGFSLLNYLLITALLVILAATGRYIFFGQDLPFGSILSKQSILFPAIILLATVFLFKRVPLEHYANRRKVVPGLIVFFLLAGLLFFVKPLFNKNREFGVADLSRDLDVYVRQEVQPVLDYFDTAAVTRRLPARSKDRLFADSLWKMLEAGVLVVPNKFFTSEIAAYSRSGFARHLDQRRILYLDLNGNGLQLSVNPNYFRVEAPPHLQELWTGNVYGDTSIYCVSLWNPLDGSIFSRRLPEASGDAGIPLDKDFHLSFHDHAWYLSNVSGKTVSMKQGMVAGQLLQGDSLRLNNPMRLTVGDPATGNEKVLVVEPEAFMRNFYVNGSRFYEYPMAGRFNWARNFAEAVSSEYTGAGETKRNAFVSFDAGIMDSLSLRIQHMMQHDTAYKKDAEYGICIADGNGRVLALSDFINGMKRPDPNDKMAYGKAIEGENGWVSQALLRKQIGNINLLRMNPGPGSTFKPIVFSAIASQLNLDWDLFASEGFSEKQHFYGGEKVPEYDFEKNNGRITRVVDYLRHSDNYYHSNVLLLGSYPKQDPMALLAKSFATRQPGGGLHWPYFTYKETDYWLDGFKNWPAYENGEVNFGTDSSFTSIGLLTNYGIYTRGAEKSFDMFASAYDSSLFRNAFRKSGFILPEYGLFDQYGATVNHRNPYDLFTSCFRGHVKGSSQVLIPPVKMAEAYGKMVSQNGRYALTLDPYAGGEGFSAFGVDPSISYNHYLDIMRENVFAGMREALFNGTAARLGGMLKNGAPYFYYGKTGTTGDDALKSKSKLFVIIISKKDITQPDFNFRNNRFYTIYFTSQAGPAKQNEEFQAAIIHFIEQTPAFKKYMENGD